MFQSLQVSLHISEALFQVNRALQKMQIGENGVLELGKRNKKEDSEQKIPKVGPIDFELKSFQKINRTEVVNVSYEHFKYKNEKRIQALDYGKIIHRILEEIETTKDVDNAIKNALQTGLISKAEAAGLILKLKKLLAIDPVIKWFGPNGLKIRERDLVDKNGNNMAGDALIGNSNSYCIFSSILMLWVDF